jgi:ubiquitin-conjugating enzyme E2 W
MSQIYVKRLTKELKEFQVAPPPGTGLLEAESLQRCVFLGTVFRVVVLHGTELRWMVRLDGAPETLYAGESFVLRFVFSASYPLDAPEVIFSGPIVPIHPHVYSNGHICLSILYDQWSPALTVASVCLSLQSMLSSCTKKVLSFNHFN